MTSKSHGPDWSRFGLNQDDPEKQSLNSENEKPYQSTNENDLFRDTVDENQKPWYKANFLITEPVKFGTWDGVFTSCMINIFGVVIFLRTGWMVGHVGIGFSILIIFMTILVALTAVLSAIGVVERCKIESGGVYFLLSHVLGGRFGASVGILYCIGQAIACSLYTVGFGESIASLLQTENIWVAKGIAIVVVVLLLGINVAGVKWVIRLQLILLLTLLVAVLDFFVGSFVKTDYENGVIGYHMVNWRNNSEIGIEGAYKAKTFFEVFGVFFPTATGVMAGINMSGELRNPKRNIPVGTLSAVGMSTFLYFCFAIILGGTCTRDALQDDYMIAAKVAWLSPLLLIGLYVSSLSAALGGLTGSPRVLQAIAETINLPFLEALSRTWGSNKVPIYSLITVTCVTLLFILIGDVNVLGPIVTMPFMITYASLDYSYFVLAMSFDMRRRRDARYAKTGAYYQSTEDSKSAQKPTGYLGPAGKSSDDDLDSLFPERTQSGTAGDNVLYDRTADRKKEDDSLIDIGQKRSSNTVVNMEITRQPQSWYSMLSNRWISLMGGVACYIIMFSINWIYALSANVIVVALFLYIGQANPGVFPGVSEFQLWSWIRNSVRSCLRQGPAPPEEVFIPPRTPAMNTEAAQLTDENQDFANRGRYHQSQPLHDSHVEDPMRD